MKDTRHRGYVKMIVAKTPDLLGSGIDDSRDFQAAPHVHIEAQRWDDATEDAIRETN